VRGRLVLALLALAPVLALAPALLEDRLVCPGDGAFLHYPLRAAAWSSLRHGELPSWNPAIFSGTALLAAYRPGALYPPMAALAFLPPFAAFQLLITLSLSAAGVLTFLYLRRLGTGLIGAYGGGLAFSLGPYLVGHLDDAATLVAAPLLPLVLLAAEDHMRRAATRRVVALAAALAALFLAGSPEASRAGLALVVGRLAVGHVFRGGGSRPSVSRSLLAVVAAFALAAPQLLPTLFAAREAGRSLTGLASESARVPGLTGLVLRYASHTPAPALALGALPLLLTQTPVRVFGVALGLCLGLQWGRGPLSAPGALGIVFDLSLAVLAGLSLSAQWSERRGPQGRRLRAYTLFAALASCAALAVSAATLGPLPDTLAGATGILALAMILYFALAGSNRSLVAGVWLLPFTVSFLLQPHGREAWAQSPTRAVLQNGTLTSAALERAMGAGRSERVLTLTRSWPRPEALDLAFGNLGGLRGQRTANGYDPMVPLRSRAAWDGIGVGGTLPGAFFRSRRDRLAALGVAYVQVPSSALRAQPDAWGLGDTLDLVLDPGESCTLPVPLGPATEVRLGSWLSDAVELVQGESVAEVRVRLGSGREIALPLRAGIETAEWALERADVRPVARHLRAPILESFAPPGGAFTAHRYLGILRLPARLFVDSVRLVRPPGRGRLTLARLALVDTVAGRSTPVSLASAFVSDEGQFHEVSSTPSVRLFAVTANRGRAYVAEQLLELPDEAAVLDALRSPAAQDIDLRRVALIVASEARDVARPARGIASRAAVVASGGSSLEVRAQGPGVLVVSEGWDPGWRASIDGRGAGVLRVNQASLGLVLSEGTHRVLLRHRPRGFGMGLAAAGIAVLGLSLSLTRHV
jgi:hypothetical protein